MKKILGFFLLLLCLAVHSQEVGASGVLGLNYTTYYGGGPSPSINNLTPITSGVVSTVNFDWGGGGVLDTGRGDGVIVRFTGYFKATTTGTYNFGTQSDDGSTLTINGTTLVNCWCEQGPTFRYGSINLTAGQVVPVEMWYYENGGGAVMRFYWYTDSGWQIVPNSNLATDSTYWAPSLQWGASSSSFSISSSNQSKVNTFVNRTTGDNQVHIEQIGNSNIINVDQTGTKQNFVNYSGNGNSNTVNITQSGNSSTQTNYIDLSLSGNSNAINLTQTSTGGGKGIFASVNDNNNTLTILQKDSGSHYANINLSGGNKSVNLTQQGSASHMADITLGGTQSSAIILTQQGSTQQFYSINHTCSTAGGCGTITVQQGQ